MANKKISELELLVTPTLADVLPIVNQNVTKKIPVGTLLQSGLPVSASSITATSVHVEGNITADSFTVVSSSIIYATGSTNFGDSFDDFHTFTGSVTITGSTTITGSVAISGSSSFVGNHILSGTTVLTGNTIISGNFEVSGSTILHNSIFVVTGSQYLTGSQWITGSLSIYGDVNVVSGSSFYRWGNKLFNYGAFSDTRTQSASLNTATSMLVNTGDVADSGVHITSGSRITFDNTGVYNIQFSVQLNRIGGSGTVTPTIWLAYTGSNVANSATDIVMTGNANDAALVPAWNWVVPIKANDWVEVKWSTPDVNIVLFATGSRTNPVRPSVPSVIITATQIA